MAEQNLFGMENILGMLQNMPGVNSGGGIPQIGQLLSMLGQIQPESKSPAKESGPIIDVEPTPHKAEADAEDPPAGEDPQPSQTGKAKSGFKIDPSILGILGSLGGGSLGNLGGIGSLGNLFGNGRQKSAPAPESPPYYACAACSEPCVRNITTVSYEEAVQMASAFRRLRES